MNLMPLFRHAGEPIDDVPLNLGAVPTFDDDGAGADRGDVSRRREYVPVRRVRWEGIFGSSFTGGTPLACCASSRSRSRSLNNATLKTCKSVPTKQCIAGKSVSLGAGPVAATVNAGEAPPGSAPRTIRAPRSSASGEAWKQGHAAIDEQRRAGDVVRQIRG